MTSGRSVSAPADSQSLLVRRLLAASWTALPALLGASALCCLAFALVVLCGPGPTPAGVVLMGTVVAPPFSLLIRTYRRVLFGPADSQVDGRSSRVRACWGGFWSPTLRLTLVPVAAAWLALLAWQMWVQTGQWWALGPLAVCAAAAVAATVASALAIALRESDPHLGTVQLWTLALTVMARQPLASASTVIVPAAGLWACLHLGASLALLVPAPAAFVVAAAVWTSDEGQRALAPTRSH